MTTVYITGSSGYVGSAVLNSLGSNYDFIVSKARAGAIDCMRLDGVNVVLHLAGLAHSKEKHCDQKIFEVNTLFPVEMALKARDAGVEKFIFLSSTAVYGSFAEAVDENSRCTPSDVYGWSKLQAERLLEKLATDNFSVVILRAPMVYGKEAPGNPRSLTKIAQRLKVLPLGGIENKRNFVSISNLVFVLRKTIDSNIQGVFCVADDNPMSTSDLILTLAKYKKFNIKLISAPGLGWFISIFSSRLKWKLFGNAIVSNRALKNALGLSEL